MESNNTAEVRNIKSTVNVPAVGPLLNDYTIFNGLQLHFLLDILREEWRKLHNEERNDLYCLPKYFSGDQIEKNEMSGACSAYGGGGRV